MKPEKLLPLLIEKADSGLPWHETFGPSFPERPGHRALIVAAVNAAPYFLARLAGAKKDEENAFYDGVILALQVMNAAGDCGDASYMELLGAAGRSAVEARAKAEGMYDLSGLRTLKKMEGR